jgi:hypothetical protein
MPVLEQADPTACCPDAYYCPTAGETECPRHGGFDVCCDGNRPHVPIDRGAWHVAQEQYEQRLLTRFFNRRHLYRGEAPEAVRRLLCDEKAPARTS